MRRLPFLTSSQRRALLVIEWLLLIGIIIVAIKTPSNSPVRERSVSSKKSTQSLPSRGGLEGSLPQEEPFETFPFDPNTADSTALLRLGLSPWQVRSVYRYRAKHGRYHVPEDFMRLPGMTVEQWERLKDYIRIAKKYQYVAPLQTYCPPSDRVLPNRSATNGRLPRGGRLPSQSVHEDLIDADTIKKSPSSSGNCPLVAEQLGRALLDGGQKGLGRGLKLKIGQTIDINTADTTLLKKIPGIASKRAARIVAYRNSLGSFVSVEQVMEAIEMPDSVLKYMTVSSQPVRKVNVNKLSVQQLMRHPYLNFYQAKAIVEYRRNKGELHSIEELSRLEGFRATDIDRLQPYIEF